MKTAVIVAGVCRFTELTYRSWAVLPEADWYLSTWNMSQQPYSPVAMSSRSEIATVSHLFADILVSDYQTEFLDLYIHQYCRPFILLEKALSRIRHLGYERIIYFRPDLKLYTLENFSTADFAVTDTEIKILDCHEPTDWIVHSTGLMQDSFFVFSWHNFNRFVENKHQITDHYDIHRGLYQFTQQHQLTVTPLYNMRSVILRERLDPESQHSLSELTDLYVKNYEAQGGRLGPHEKFARLEIKFSEPDLEKIRISQSQGGILKLRNRRR